jgi:hypothetical protein
VYWIQNRPDAQDYDGESDFEGQEENVDAFNRLLSATNKGTVANVDPTLVVKMDPAANDGTLRKGSDNAIFSPGGADYLELKGTAVQAAERQLERLRAYILDVCGVVMADPEKLAGAAQSARALEILYAPMLSNADILREQYGEHGIKPILTDMLRMARRFEALPTVLDEETGELVQTRFVLPPKMERIEDGDEGDDDEIAVDRVPGESETIALNWRPYFAATWADIKNATASAKEANGGRPSISQRTSVQAVAALFGVEDIDAEMDRIEEENEKAVEQAQKAMGGGPDPADGALYALEEERAAKAAKTAKAAGVDLPPTEPDAPDDAPGG